MIRSLLSHKVLFEGRWGFKKGSMTETEYQNLIETKARPALNQIIDFDRQQHKFSTTGIYGYFRCRASGIASK
ncbi:hypothetical protein MASR1M12_34720 [Erysipelotrichia bacterium]